MRTTLILNDELAAAAKELAARRRTTFSELVNESLRRTLRESRSDAPVARFSMATYAPAGSEPTDTLPRDLDAFLDDSANPAG